MGFGSQADVDKTKNRSYLDQAIRGYERGFYLRNDYYNGINYAFLLNERRSVQPTWLSRSLTSFKRAACAWKC